MIISSSVLRARSICTRWFASVADGKRQQNLSKKLAMETLKKKIAEEPNDRTDYTSILLNSFRSHDTDPSLSAYTFLIRHLLRNRMLAHVSSVFEHLEKDESVDVPETMFVTVIENFGRAGRLKDAVDLFFRIPKFRITPSVVPLNTLLAILCESEEGLALVGDVLSKAPTMNILFEGTNFSILTDAICRNGELSFATELLEIMQLHTIDPNVRLYTIVLTLLCKPGGFAQVTEFLEKIRNAGEYSHVIASLIDKGKADDAHGLVVLMKMEGKMPDIMMYNRIMEAFILSRQFLKADDLFQEIRFIGLKPCCTTYNTYLNGFCRQGNFIMAFQMVIGMAMLGCRPDDETIKTVVEAYTKPSYSVNLPKAAEWHDLIRLLRKRQKAYHRKKYGWK